MRNRVSRTAEKEVQQAPEQPSVEVASTSSISDVPLSSAPPTIGFVVDLHPEVDLPLPQLYKVLETRPVLYAGNRVVLKKGKYLDERVYDLSVLLEQGVKLEPV